MENIFKKIWWIFVIVAIIVIVSLDRSDKTDMEYEYNSFKVEQAEQIVKVDSLSSRTQENTVYIDTIKNTYTSQRDSLDQLKHVYELNKNVINDLNDKLNALNKKNDSIVKDKIKIKKQLQKDIDSFRTEIKYRDKKIIELENENSSLNKKIEKVSIKFNECNREEIELESSDDTTTIENKKKKFLKLF